MPIAWVLVGLVLGALFVLVARALGERLVFAAGLVFAALIYVGFAVYGHAGAGWLGVELVGVVLYGAMAVLGLRHTQWWLALGWATHPIWDTALHLAGGGGAFAPAWYAILCMGFDVIVALYIAFRCWRRPVLRTN